MSKWNFVSLDTIAELKHGYQFRDADFVESGIPIIKIGNVQNGKLNLENITFIDENRFNEFERYQLHEGDILMSLTGNIGRIVELKNVSTKLLQNYRVGKFTPKDNKVSISFLKYVLSDESLFEQLSKFSNQSAQANFGKNDLSKLSVWYPENLDSQSKIAEILSTIDKAIDQTEAIIAKQQRIKNGLMQDLLTKGIDENGNLRSGETHEFKDSELGRVPKEWEVKSLSSVTSLISSGVTPRGGYKIYKKEGIPFIRSQNVYPYGIITEDIVFISDEIHESMPRTKVQNFDVLLNITGASIGRCCQVPKGFSESNVNQHVCIIRLNNNSEEYSKFIATFLASDFGQRQIFNQMAGGNREGLNFDEIGSFHVPEIDDKEAQRITNSIEKIEKTITALEQENNKLKRQKTGLMQDLLTGKVSVDKLINTTN